MEILGFNMPLFSVLLYVCTMWEREQEVFSLGYWLIMDWIWLAELETKVYKKVCYQGEGPHFSLLKAPTTFHIHETINY